MLTVCLPSGWPYSRKLRLTSSSVRVLYAFVSLIKYSLASSMVWPSASLTVSGWLVQERIRDERVEYKKGF